MSDPALASELDATIDAAIAELDRSIMEAKLNDDPLRHPLSALSSFLRAQRRLYVDANLTLKQQLEAARQPVHDRELYNAVVAGIRSCSPGILSAFNWRTLTQIAGFLAVLIVGSLIVGGVGGWWLFERQNEGVMSWGHAAIEACSSVPVVDGACHATIKLR